MNYAKLTAGGSRRRRHGLPDRTGVLLNAHWHEPRGGPRTRCCPTCDADVAADDHAVHYGGELYHPDCALYPPDQQ